MEFTIEEKKIVVYPSQTAGRPVIYLNTFAEEGEVVYKLLRDSGCPDFSLVAVSGLDWNHDMSPWSTPPISKDDPPFTGGADEYLQLMTEEILPKAEEQIPGEVSFRGLAGYSLAGMFAVYTICHTDFFSRIASVSGSLWFPDFIDYIFVHEMIRRPELLYFSLGDRECRTANPYLRTVQKCTEEIVDFYKKEGIATIYQLNRGNHFKNAVKRTVAGISWLLKR